MNNKQKHQQLETIATLVIASEANGFSQDSIQTLETMDITESTTEMMVEAVAQLNNSTISVEYNDNASEFNPLAISLASTLTLNESTALSAGPWADIKMLPKSKSALAFEFPHYSIESLKNGEVVSSTNLADLDKDDATTGSLSKIHPTYHADNATLFHAFSIRTGPVSSKTASFVIGKDISLYDAAVLQTDMAAATLGRIDLIAPGCSVQGFMLEVELAGVKEYVYVHAKDTINSNNNFSPLAAGSGSEEALAANFVFSLNTETKKLVNGNSIDSGASIASDNLSTLTPAHNYTISVDIDAKINRKSGLFIPRSAVMQAKTISAAGSGVHEEIEISDPISDLTISVVALDLDARLTNSSHRNIGNIIVSDETSYYCMPKPKDVLSVMIPVDEKDQISTDSVFNSIEVQGYKNKTDMSKAVIASLPEVANKIKLFELTGVKPNIPNEMTFRPTYIEDTFSAAGILVQRSSEATEVTTKALQLKIEALANLLARKSAWHNISLFKCSGYEIEVLVGDSVILSDFTTSEGVTVNVAKTILCSDSEVWISFKAIGGPVIQGVEVLRLATVIVVPSAAYISVKADGTASYKAVTTEPHYDVMTTLPILGKITIS